MGIAWGSIYFSFLYECWMLIVIFYRGLSGIIVYQERFRKESLYFIQTTHEIKM